MPLLTAQFHGRRLIFYDSWYGSGRRRSCFSNVWRRCYLDKMKDLGGAKEGSGRSGCRNVCDTRNPQSKWNCKFCEASWDWSEECGNCGTRDSDTDIWTGGPSWLAKRKRQ